MNIFEALRADHDRQRALADALIATEGASEERKELFGQLKTELKAHAAAEERHFYNPLITDDSTQEKARHSVAEHHDIDESIEKLEKTDYSAPAWLIEARNLRHLVFHHLDEEEHEVFQMAGKVLTENQKKTLATHYRQTLAEQKSKDW